MNVLMMAGIDDNHASKIKQSQPEWNFIEKKRFIQKDIDEADIIIGNPSRRYNLNQENLKAILLNSAGNEQYLEKDILHPNTLLTNGSGSYGITISEHTIGMILALNKNFHEYFNNMNASLWRPNFTGYELYHSTVLIVGLGDIGYQLAKRLKAFDCKIIGIKRTYSEVDFVDTVDTIDHLDDYLPEADYVISCLPGTKDTTHLFNKKRFSLMKSNALFVNVGRGSVVRNKDLVNAVAHLWIRGAALDVVEEEPLDQSSPLWRMSNIFITPHASGGYHWQSVQDYYTDLVIRNLEHIKNHEPLENLVDKNKGYRETTHYHR